MVEWIEAILQIIGILTVVYLLYGDSVVVSKDFLLSKRKKKMM